MVYGIGGKTVGGRNNTAARDFNRDVPVFSGRGHTLDNSGSAQVRRGLRRVGQAVTLLSWAAWLQIVIWFVLLKFALLYHVGVIFFIASGFYIIFTNLGERKDSEEYSAYSVFNKGMKRLPGQYTTEAFERELTGRHGAGDD